MSAAVAQLGALLEQLQARVAALEGRAGVAAPVAAAVAAPAAAAAADDEVSPVTAAFDELVKKYGDELAAVCAKIGGDVDTIGKIFSQLFAENRKIIDVAAKCKKPDAAALAALRKGVTDAAAPINDLKKKRDTTFPSHIAGAADAMPAWFWVTVDSAPMAIIDAARENCDFYLNKVRKESKDNNKPDYMTFANLVRDSVAAIHAFVKENFKMGLSFNPKGADFASYSSAAAAAPKPAASPAAAAGAGATAAAGAGSAELTSDKKAAALQGALFAELSSIDQSSGRTAGLRHVTKDMKSSAQKKEGEAAPVVSPKAPVAKVAVKAAGDDVPTGKPATLSLVGNRWNVEYQQEKGAQIHVPSEGKSLTLMQEVYIFGCKDVYIFIDAKCKGVSVDRCSNVTIITGALLSGVTIVNSKKVKVQCNGVVPSVAIDKTDGCVVGLCYDSRDAQIVTSKSSEMNVTFPVAAGDDAEWVELPIPEQFVSKIGTDNKVTSSVSELYSS